MFSSNQEFYEYIEKLIQRLDGANEKKWSAEFNNALAFSSLPGEVLGKLWLTLRNFQTTKIPKELGMKDEIEKVIESLGKILGN
jgi:hypothetical protein